MKHITDWYKNWEDFKWKLLFILIGIMFLIMIFGCSSYNAPRGTGWVTTTPVSIVTEIPENKLPKLDTMSLNKKPKDRKGMIKMPLHTIHESELTKKQIKEYK